MARELADQPDAELEAQVRQLREQAAQYRNVAQSKDELANDIEAELNRRATVSYFNAHPELERLAFGDDLLVTQSFHDLKDIQVHQSRFYQVGKQCKLESVLIINGKLHATITNLDDVWSTGLDDMSVLQDMRRAYLRDNPSATSDTDG